MIVLFRKADGGIIGVHAQPAVVVAAWLNDPANAEIAAETGYLEIDERAAAVPQLIAQPGKFRVDTKTMELREVGGQAAAVPTASAARDALQKIDFEKGTVEDLRTTLSLALTALGLRSEK